MSWEVSVLSEGNVPQHLVVQSVTPFRRLPHQTSMRPLRSRLYQFPDLLVYTITTCRGAEVCPKI